MEVQLHILIRGERLASCPGRLINGKGVPGTHCTESLAVHEDSADYLENRNWVTLKMANIIFLHGLGRLTCSGIDALPSFPGESTISFPPRFVVEGVFGKSGVVHSFEMVDPVLFVFGFHVLYSRDL